MAQQMTRPRGRRPGNDDTRGLIAEAALELFDSQGYDRTSLRAIARAAQVDPALVHHYFSSKGQLLITLLLGSALDFEFTDFLDGLLEGDRDELGLRVARACLDSWENPAYQEPMRAFLIESGSQRARLATEFLAREVFGRIAEELGHRNALLRGQIAASTFQGLLQGRHQMAMGALSSARTRDLVEPLGRALQDYLVEEW